MLEDLRAWPMLDGARGREKADVEALCTMITALSSFACAHVRSVASVELNPVAVLPEGQGAVALDAVISPIDGKPC